MKKIMFSLLVGCVGILAAAQVLAADRPVAKIKLAPLAQHQVWSLLRGSGPELYRDFCASCHGLDAKGNATAARALGVSPPDLTRLRKAGISSKHVAYVLRSSCDEAHHWAPDGTATMPCWQRILRHGIGSDAAAFPIINRLIEYVDSIQVTKNPSAFAGSSPL